MDVICFGALNIDKLYKVDGIAGKGEERSIIDFKECPGGSAANTAVGLARLGLKVGYIGKVSNDREGELVIRDFKHEGINTEGIIVSKGVRSGIVMGYIDQGGERALYVDSGVNDSLEFKDIDLEYAGSAKFLHLTSFVGEKPFETQKQLLKVLPEHVKVSFDPGDIYARKGLSFLKPIVKRSFAILPNENEIKLLTGEGYKKGAKIFLHEGVSKVAIKLGERGCYVTNINENHLVAPYTVKVLDTTGAGDAFCTGFIYGLIKNKNIYESGKLGNFVASRCIEKIGAREGLPRLSDLHLI